jgi:hypothetical protein
MQISIQLQGEEKFIKVLIRIFERKRLLERPERRWENNIKLNHKEIGWEDMGWVYPTQDRHSWRAFMYQLINIWVS